MTLSARNRIILHVLIVIDSVSLFTYLVKRIISDNWLQIKLASLDSLRPYSFRYLCTPVNLNQLKIDEVYFEHVRAHFGSRVPEVSALLGYCAYQRKDFDRALSFYKKAMEENPQVFWYPYNLGVIYLRQDRYADALSMFKTALSMGPKDTISLSFSSKVYVPILVDNSLYTFDKLLAQFEQGRQRAMELAFLAQIRLENKPAEYNKDSLPLACY